MSDSTDLLEEIAAAEDAFSHASGRPTFEPVLNAGADAEEGEVQIQKACRLLALAHEIDDLGAYYGAILEHSFIAIEQTLQGTVTTADQAERLRRVAELVHGHIVGFDPDLERFCLCSSP